MNGYILDYQCVDFISLIELPYPTYFLHMHPCPGVSSHHLAARPLQRVDVTSEISAVLTMIDRRKRLIIKFEGEKLDFLDS